MIFFEEASEVTPAMFDYLEKRMTTRIRVTNLVSRNEQHVDHLHDLLIVAGSPESGTEATHVIEPGKFQDFELEGTKGVNVMLRYRDVTPPIDNKKADPTAAEALKK